MMRRPAPLLVAVAAFALAVARAPADPDMYWHLASGQWMVQHGSILRTDVFSSTVAGETYSVGEWLGQIVLYLAYAAGSWAGVVLLRGMLVAIAAFFLTRVALRSGRAAIAVPLVIAALLLSTIVWTDRPQLFTLALFPVLLDLLLGARAGQARSLILVPPLLLLWTNLHGGYALGLALIALFAIDAIVRRAQVRWFVIAALSAALATLVDPGALGLASVMAHAAAPPHYIVEESPPDVLRPAGFVFALFLLATLAVGLRAGGSLLDALVLVPLLLLSLSAQRDMPYFAFVAVPYLTARLPLAVAPLRIRLTWSVGSRALGPAAAIAVVAMALLAIASLPDAPDESAYPRAAVADVRGGHGTLLNEYDWGGYLIWNAPERPVFLDGRLFPYLPDVLADFNTVVALRPGWRDVIERYHVTSALLRPDRPLAGALREDGWRLVAGDARFVLLERP